MEIPFSTQLTFRGGGTLFVRAIGTVNVAIADTVLGNAEALIVALKLIVGATGLCAK